MCKVYIMSPFYHNITTSSPPLFLSSSLPPPLLYVTFPSMTGGGGKGGGARKWMCVFFLNVFALIKKKKNRGNQLLLLKPRRQHTCILRHQKDRILSSLIAADWNLSTLKLMYVNFFGPLPSSPFSPYPFSYSLSPSLFTSNLLSLPMGWENREIFFFLKKKVTYFFQMQAEADFLCLKKIKQGEWIAKGLESGTKFEGVDLQEGEWFDYDEKVGEEVSVKDLKWEIRRV